MRCAACNARIVIAAGERIGFRDTCDGCSEDLHCCLNCAHHDPSAYNECREANSERVADREREDHRRHAVGHEAQERDEDPRPFGDPEDDDVGRSTDWCAVASQAGAQGAREIYFTIDATETRRREALETTGFQEVDAGVYYIRDAD